MEIPLIFYLVQIDWAYIESCYPTHDEHMDITVYCGDEDVTDDISDSDWEVIERLCYADKDNNEETT